MPPVAPITEPARVIVEAFAQTLPSAPAFTIGAGVKVITLASLTGVQPPLPVVVRVGGRDPAAISAAVGVYTAFSVVLLGVKVPVPPDHWPPVATVTAP